jgi:Family of unknown function (DUF5335)
LDGRAAGLSLSNFYKEADMANQIDMSKSLPREQWGEFFDQFSDGNRGRSISIEIIDLELGNEELVKSSPLMAMIYDRPEKGDDLVIEVGKEQVTYAHTIDSPTEVLTGQDATSVVVAVWISDANGTKTLIQLETR